MQNQSAGMLYTSAILLGPTQHPDV